MSRGRFGGGRAGSLLVVTALAVVKYYELRNKSVLVLCPKKLANNWLTYNSPLKTNILADDRLNYTVLNHTDLQRTKGESYGMPLNQVNWGNFDLIVIGTHGRSGLAHMLLGSVAEKVVRKANCPVLTVRPEDHEFEMP